MKSPETWHSSFEEVRCEKKCVPRTESGHPTHLTKLPNELLEIETT